VSGLWWGVCFGMGLFQVLQDSGMGGLHELWSGFGSRSGSGIEGKKTENEDEEGAVGALGVLFAL
jgi:hypothetical protein